MDLQHQQDLQHQLLVYLVDLVQQQAVQQVAQQEHREHQVVNSAHQQQVQHLVLHLVQQHLDQLQQQALMAHLEHQVAQVEHQEHHLVNLQQHLQ